MGVLNFVFQKSHLGHHTREHSMVLETLRKLRHSALMKECNGEFSDVLTRGVPGHPTQLLKHGCQKLRFEATQLVPEVNKRQRGRKLHTKSTCRFPARRQAC
jgi:hypothetical protein